VPSLPPNARAPDAGPRTSLVWLAALGCALGAFALYRATLLPGVDFGDTGSLQTMAGEALITPRDGYPIYFAIAGLFLHVAPIEPARALNLLSAIEAAAACGLFVVVATRLAGWLPAAVAGAVLFAASYTFWSQAVIAEVYALHAVFVLLTLLLLLRWAERPTLARLAAFFACYAFGFGNHLSMVLLLPAYTLFLLTAAPQGWRSMLRPRVVALAIALACAGALPYLWNVRSLWFLQQPPPDPWTTLQAFWFDVTKQDWRDTMVLQVPRSMLSDHLAMYWFDLRQQFGIVGPALAAGGLVGLAVSDMRRAALVALVYAANVAFAFSYNVGDAHVFYIPSHLAVALLAAAGVGAIRRRSAEPVAVLVVLLTAIYGGFRAYHDFPALDRTEDRRATEALDRLAGGLDDQHEIMVADLNWQIANGLSYYAKVLHPEIAVAWLPHVLLYLPALAADNRAAGREVVLTDRARDVAAEAYGPLAATVPDDRTPTTSLTTVVSSLPSGTRYVLCVLRPTREFQLDRDDLASAARRLEEGTADFPDGDYAAIAGRVGARPDLAFGSNLPFSREVQVDGVAVEIRMESWLASDTIRRMGFGHVVAARRHTLIVERGVSFAAFDDRGRPIRTAYAAGLFAPQPRYRLRAR
jgi:transmembrane protein TMEM260 (protein O-mannosyltransferase)